MEQCPSRQSSTLAIYMMEGDTAKDLLNSTSENSTADEEPRNNVMGPEYHYQVRLGTLSAMILISLAGNIAMCFHMKQKWRKRTRVHLLFANLACADLLVTAFAMTSQLVWESMDREWVGGEVFCRLFKVFQTFTMVSSNYLIVAIALDRHIAIVSPLARNPRTKMIIYAAWTASLIPSLPNAYIFHTFTVPSGKAFCVAKFYTSSLSRHHRQVYMAFIILSVFILPVLVTVGLYARILYVIWTRSKKFHEQGDTQKEEPMVSTVCLQGKTTNSHLPRAKVKTLKMTLAVVATFLATCLPYMAQEIVIAFGDPSLLNQNVVAMSGIISASNSALNPYIYFLFNSQTQVAKKITNSLCNCLLPLRPRQANNSEMNSSV